MSIPEHMRAALLTAHGGPETLVVTDAAPVPVPGPGDVLIKVAAAGVNNTDINTRIGWYSKGDNDSADAGWTGEALRLPRIQGADVAGKIVAVGPDVPKDRIGDRVIVEGSLTHANGVKLKTPWYLGSECDGGFADYLRVNTRHAHRIESPLTDVELASFPCSYSTAENMLTRAGVTVSDRVLVTGASGGVGSATVQLARARGANVVAVTSPSKSAALLELGANETLGRDADLVAALGANNVDVVVDLVAGPSWPSLLDVLRPGGRYAVAGAIGGPMVTLDVRTLYLKDLSLFGCTVLGDGVFAALVQRIEAGEVRPLVAETFRLEDIHAAQEFFIEKSHVGKIVLTL
ncbi:MAG: alcohol dehydrogenase family protein [Pseudomonadota bacterium]